MTKAYVVVDLCYGDAGKGTIVDFLSRQASNSMVVRYNGGAQAAHNVITPDGLHHTFSQFGSGTLFPTTKTLLSRFMLVNPYALLAENDGLKKIGCTDALDRLYIDESALITTPFQQAANRIKEAIYGNVLSGSCGKGIWETIADAVKFPAYGIHVRDLKRNNHGLREKLQFNQKMKCLEVSNLIKDKVIKDPEIMYEINLLENPAAPRIIANYYEDFFNAVNVVEWSYLSLTRREYSQIIFEGAQGVLLDKRYGFAPYTTWTDITIQNAKALLFSGLEVKTIGVFRTYFHRHGPGPFVTEDNSLNLPEKHNDNNRWQKHFRVGYFDLVAAKYAVAISGGVDTLAMTHLDYLWRFNNKQICTAYQYTGSEPEQLPYYFKTFGKDMLVDEILPMPDIPLEREQQARMLFDMKPVYTESPIDIEEYISRQLKLPVEIRSSGETANEKEMSEEIFA